MQLDRFHPRVDVHDDSGMTLIELMVAIVLFGLLSTAVLTTLNYTINATRNDRNRAAASTLAQRELEITRNQFYSYLQGPTSIVTNQVTNPNQLAGGTAGQPLVVDGAKYTVIRSAEWAQPTGLPNSSPCDNGGTGDLAYLHVHVEVTWERMGTIKPVESDTLLSPPKGTYASNVGHIGVKVVDRDGQPVQGVPVALSGVSSGSGTTSDDGCAIFAFLAPGSYTVSMVQPTFINSKGVAAPTYSATVLTGQLTRVVADWDQASTLNVGFSPPSGGYSLPSGNPVAVSLGNSGLVPSGRLSIPGTGTSRTLGNLWPYASGYQVWSGDCLDSDAQFWGGSRSNPVVSDPNTTSSATLSLYPVDVLVLKGVLPQSGLTVVARHVVGSTVAGDTGCPSGETLTLGVTDGSGRVKGSLPYGAWQYEVSGSLTKPQSQITPSQPSAIKTVSMP